MPTLHLKHSVTYETTGDAQISDVATSLLASEKLIKLAFNLLEECIDGFKIDSVDVKLREVTNNSPLKELLAAALVITYQEDLVK